jgi:hypothetical protein
MVSKDQNTLQCRPIETRRYTPLNIPFSRVGVATYVGVEDTADLVTITRQEVLGKAVILANQYIVAIPTNVLNEGSND